MLLRQEPTKRHCFNRLPLILSTLLVLFIYQQSKPAKDKTITTSESEFLELYQSIKKSFPEETTIVPFYDESRFNPFNNATRNVNDVMAAYTYSSFGLSEVKDRPIKKILFWNEAYGSKDYGIGFGQQGFQQLNCPISECSTTDNRSLVATDEFDAIVFHLRTFNIDDLPPKRSKHQRWIFWSLESPQYNMRDIYPLDGLFNWTMTYRLDSDIVQPYGWVQPIHPGSFTLRPDMTKEIKLAMEVAAGRKSKSKKTKLVAWFVSNCQSQSKREKYANALAKFVQVDVYGDCGSLSCDRDDAANCYGLLDQEYKFYLSFENSYCDDYVTEKLFSILQLEVVPIVFGGANYSAHIAPPFSYIDARDFKSARQLADYLKLLDANDELYNQYFWWKPYYRIRNHIQDLKLSMCGLCSRLHSDTAVKIYEDMEKWWVSDSHCHIPRPENVFRIPYWTS